MIHQYKLNGYNIVLDVFSGSVHCVDELAYDVIEMYDKNDRDTIVGAMLEKYADNPEITKQEINDCIDDIQELKVQGKLFTEDKYENLAFDMNTLRELGCEYLFAGGEILDAAQMGLEPMGYFETETSYWGILLYQLKN